MPTEAYYLTAEVGLLINIGDINLGDRKVDSPKRGREVAYGTPCRRCEARYCDVVSGSAGKVSQ